MSEKLKPCPFCGSPNMKPEPAGSNGLGWVVCQQCRAHGPEGTFDEALAAWNRRGCDHDFSGGRQIDGGLGWERVCSKCGMGAMEHTLRNDPT